MKKLILIAVVLIILGAVVFAASAAAIHFDFTNLDTGNYETNTYTVKERFRSISIDATTEKIVFRPSENTDCKVVCFEEEHRMHTVAVTDGTLTVTAVDTRKPTDHLFSLKVPEITVYLPERVYSELRIATDTGDIEIPADFSFDSISIQGDTSDVVCLASAKGGIGIALSTGDITMASIDAGALDLKVTTGKIHADSIACEGDVFIRVGTGKTRLQDVTCRSLTSEGTTGKITLDHVVAADTVRITRGTGDVEFNASDAETVFVKTSTGDVTGSLLSEKVFLTETDTGKVDVPKSIRGGKCEISTDTGDIRITIG